MKILNFGSCNVDYVYSLDHIVNAGETETTCKLEIFPGGKGLNQSIALSRAGLKIYHAGCIGSDGKFLAEILNRSNVNTTFIRHTEERNGHAIIQVSKDGENSIFLYPGSNELITKEHIDTVLSNFSCDDVLLLQNEINNLDYIIKKANQIGMRIILNPSPYNEEIDNIDFNMLYCLVLNEVEAKAITGSSEADKLLEYFESRYPQMNVMLTLGKKGCIYQSKGNRIYHPIFKTNVVDTTAAGDTFTGYFVAGVVSGDESREVIKRASCAAAIAVSKKGAEPSIPDIATVLERIKFMQLDDRDYKSEKINEKIIGYIDGNIRTASLAELAEILGYSSVYTGKLTEKITGKKFKDLLMDKRLELSSKMLLESDIPIGEIIKKIGYENESFFRKIFREKYGKNPLEFRKKGL